MERARETRVGRVVVLCAAGVLVASLAGCPPHDGKPQNGGALLKGTWSGTVACHADLAVQGGPPAGKPFDRDFTVTFDETGQPDVTAIVIDANRMISLSMANLVDVGDTDEQTFTEGGAAAVVKATVTAVSRSGSAYQVSLDLTVSYAPYGALHGSYTTGGTVQPDGTLAWDGAGVLTVPFGSSALDLNIGASGTLTRQP